MYYQPIMLNFSWIEWTFQTISNAPTDTTTWLNNFITGGGWIETDRKFKSVTFTDATGQFITFLGTGLKGSNAKITGLEFGNGSTTIVTASADQVVGIGGAFTETVAKSLASDGVLKGTADFTGGRKTDVFTGAAKNDIFRGKGGDDFFFGRGGNDLVLGQNGDDRLEGQNGDDIIRGGKGLDIVRGGNGNDKLTGDLDADVFVFDTDDDRDVLRDFAADDYLLVIGATASTGFWLAEDLVGTGTLADLSAADQVTLGLTVSEAGGHTRIVMSGGTTMVVKNTAASAIGLDQLAFTDAGAKAGVNGLEAVTGLDWHFETGWP